MSVDEEFERRLPAAMGDALEGLRPPPDLAQRGAARGRRMRRARAAGIGGVAAATALVAAAGTLLAGGASRPVAGHGATERIDPAASTVHTPAAPPRVSPGQVLRALESLLPHGGTVSGASASAPDGYQAQLTWKGPRGTSGIDISIQRMDSPDQSYGCLPVQVRPYDQCHRRTLADGSVLTTTRSFTYPSNNTGQRRWYVALVTPSHAQLFLEEFGGGGEKSSTSSADPALSMDQLTSMVTSPAWKPALTSLAGRAGGTTHRGIPSAAAVTPARSDAALASVLASLLPRGGTLSDTNAGPGLVQLSYNDGKGRSMVEVDVQDGMAEALQGWFSCSRPHQGSCTVRTLADGTEVKRTEGPDEKTGGTVVRAVDMLRPDGRRVLVMSVNSYAQGGPVTRPEPALTLDQMETIALSPRWQTAH